MCHKRSYAGLFSDDKFLYPVCFASVRFKGKTAIIYCLFLADALSYLNKAKLHIKVKRQNTIVEYF